MIETCMLGRIVNVIKDSEMDQLSTPWVVARMSSLLSWCGSIVEDPGVVGDCPAGQGIMALLPSESLDVDEPVYIKESMRLGPFQTQILEYSVKPPDDGDCPAWWGMTVAPQTACPAHIHEAQNEQQQGVHHWQEHVGVPSLLEERHAGGQGGLCITGGASRAFPRDGSSLG